MTNSKLSTGPKAGALKGLFARVAPLLVLCPLAALLTDCIPQGWSRAQSIETFEIAPTIHTTTEYPDVALNDAGHAVAVWRDVGEVWSSRFSLFTGWTAPELIETEFGFVGQPQVEIDAAGNAIAVWSRSNGGPHSIWANRSTLAGGWGVAAEIADFGVGSGVLEDALAMDSAGNAVLAFTRNPGVDDPMRAVVLRYTVGGGWDTPTVVDAVDAVGGQVSHGLVDVDINDSGDIVVAWMQESTSTTSTPGDLGFWANVHTAATGWGTAARIHPAPNGGDRGHEPDVAVDPVGNATAVYRIGCSVGCTDPRLVAMRYEPATGWASPEVIFDDDGGDTSDVTVSARADDEVMVVWLESQIAGPGSSADHVVSSRRYAQGVWQPVQQIYPDPGDPPLGTAEFSVGVDSDMDANGNVIAVFPELRPGMPQTLLARRFVPGVGWEEPVAIDNELPHIAPLYPAISMADDGAATVVWTERVDLLRQTWAVQYSP